MAHRPHPDKPAVITVSGNEIMRQIGEQIPEPSSSVDYAEIAA